LNELT